MQSFFYIVQHFQDITLFERIALGNKNVTQMFCKIKVALGQFFSSGSFFNIVYVKKYNKTNLHI